MHYCDTYSMFDRITRPIGHKYENIVTLLKTAADHYEIVAAMRLKMYVSKNTFVVTDI